MGDTSDTFGCNMLSYVAQLRGSRNCFNSTNVVTRAGRRFTFWWPGNAELMEIRVHKRQLLWVDVSKKVAKLS